jgi:hypothetical protein
MTPNDFVTFALHLGLALRKSLLSMLTIPQAINESVDDP